MDAPELPNPCQSWRTPFRQYIAISDNTLSEARRTSPQTLLERHVTTFFSATPARKQQRDRRNPYSRDVGKPAFSARHHRKKAKKISPQTLLKRRS